MATLAEAAATSAERFVYFQLSSLHGFVEYDLRRDRVRRLVFLPLSATARGLPRQDYSLDSAHHGLAMNPRGTKLCAAGTTSNYAAIVRRRTMTQPAQPPTRAGRTPLRSSLQDAPPHAARAHPLWVVADADVSHLPRRPPRDHGDPVVAGDGHEANSARRRWSATSRAPAPRGSHAEVSPGTRPFGS
jgi:hypothetical protein